MPMRVRPPAVAGMFYPGDPNGLRTMVDTLLEQAREQVDKLFFGAQPSPVTKPSPVTQLSPVTQPSPATETPPVTQPKAGSPRDSLVSMIVPHAGYIYSGSTAALGYALLERLADKVKHIVILGPTHRVGIRGIALPGVDAMKTPLGTVPLWASGVERALAQPFVVASPEVHAQEHSLEVQLPFLQTVVPGADVLPLAVGWVEPEVATTVIDAVWDADTFIVISSDLSHYHPYAEAQRIDRGTVEQILAGEQVDHDQACGATGVDAMTLAARTRGLEPRLIGMCNSGDTAGDKSGVVGYATIGFYGRSV